MKNEEVQYYLLKSEYILENFTALILIIIDSIYIQLYIIIKTIISDPIVHHELYPPWFSMQNAHAFVSSCLCLHKLAVTS